MPQIDNCWAVITKAGHYGILVSNADIQHLAPIEDFPVDTWRAVIAINMPSTVGRDEAVIRAYVRDQEKEEQRVDQLRLM